MDLLIYDMQTIIGQVEFLVHWVGTSQEEDEWFTREQIVGTEAEQQMLNFENGLGIPPEP